MQGSLPPPVPGAVPGAGPGQPGPAGTGGSGSAGGLGPGDRRERSDRRHGDRRKQQVPVAVERRSGRDRRLGDRRARSMNAYELGPDELELIHAVNAHKARTGRAFPTWSELLHILRSLGYEKRR